MENNTTQMAYHMKDKNHNILFSLMLDMILGQEINVDVRYHTQKHNFFQVCNHETKTEIMIKQSDLYNFFFGIYLNFSPLFFFFYLCEI